MILLLKQHPHCLEAYHEAVQSPEGKHNLKTRSCVHFACDIWRVLCSAENIDLVYFNAASVMGDEILKSKVAAAHVNGGSSDRLTSFFNECK